MPNPAKSDAPILAKKDRDLLQELGFLDCDSPDSCYDLISKLTMRRLDHLKMMLARYCENYDAFSAEVKEGIARNDYHSFAEATYTLIRA
jgi:hypothetical protein